MGGAGWLSLIPTLPDFAGAGMNWAVGGMAANRYKESVRHLRRREYQDMVYSMKKAGINPILASGATPGHSAGFMSAMGGGGGGSAGVGTAMAANRQAGVSEAKAPSEINLTTARQQSAQEERLNTIFGRANILQQYDETRARIENIHQQTYNSALEARLIEKKTGLTDAETNKLKSQQGMLEETGGYGTSFEGLIRQFLRPLISSALEDARNQGR